MPVHCCPADQNSLNLHLAVAAVLKQQVPWIEIRKSRCVRLHFSQLYERLVPLLAGIS